MQKRQNSLYPYLVLSDKTLIATKLKNLVFTEFQNFRGFVGSPWEKISSVFVLVFGYVSASPSTDLTDECAHNKKPSGSPKSLSFVGC